jgi:N-acetylglucosaminyldiphosphoundecaprenol N-acetyl-beta-D-mannosaminyltransferase
VIDCGTTTLMGIPIHRMRMADVVSTCDRCIETRQLALIGVVNVAKLVKARRDAYLRQSLGEADFIVADGMPIVWLSRFCGCALPERVAGIDVMHALLELADRKGYKVYFLGATREVVERVAEFVRRSHPGVLIAGFRDGYFSPEQEPEVAEAIRTSHADILFVGMPTPRKENFLSRWRQRMRVPVCHGVGGSFDVVAGIARRAPAWMQRCGLEWLYRVIQEPRRMWKRYLVTNSIFMWLSLVEIVAHRFGFRRSKQSDGKGLMDPSRAAGSR